MWKNFTAGLIGLLILLGVIFITFLLLKNPSSTPVSTTSAISPTLTPTPTIEPVSEWKTYSDKNISFKYPGSVFGTPIPRNNQLLKLNSSSPQQQYYINITSDSQNYQKKTQTLQAYPHVQILTQTKNITVSGKQATQTSVLLSGFYDTYVYVNGTPSYNFVFYTTSKSAFDAYESLFETLLSTVTISH